MKASAIQPTLLDKITQFAQDSDKVFALILVGSRARSEQAADQYSDTDLLMIVDDPQYFIHTDGWLSEIGKMHISFMENTITGQPERRVLFDGAQDVDFVINSIADAEQALVSGEAADILRRGYRVLVDKRSFRYPPTTPETAFQLAAEAEYLDIVNDFWYHTIWTAKKLLRGELWAAKFCVDGYMKHRLLWMIEQHEHSVRQSGCNTWYGGRFIDSWAAEDVRAGLQTAFAHYNSADLAAALIQTMKLFRKLAQETAQARGFTYPAHADDYASVWVQAQLASKQTAKGESV